MAPDVLDMRGAAAELGVHYDTFRHLWRSWSNPQHPDYCAFPAPFRCPPAGRGGSYAWRASAIADWKRARETALCVGAPERRPRGRPPLQPHQPAAKWSALANQRAQLARLMESAWVG